MDKTPKQRDDIKQREKVERKVESVKWKSSTKRWFLSPQRGLRVITNSKVPWSFGMEWLE